MKSVNDIIKEQTGAKDYVPGNLIRNSWRAAAEELLETDEWFKQQCLDARSDHKRGYGLGSIELFGPLAVQETLFAISMLFIDSGMSDEELTEIMKQKTP